MPKILFIEQACLGTLQMNNLPMDLEILIISNFNNMEGHSLNNLPIGLKHLYIHYLPSNTLFNLIQMNIPFGCQVSFCSDNGFILDWHIRKLETWMTIEGIENINNYKPTDIDGIFTYDTIDYIQIIDGCIYINFKFN